MAHIILGKRVWGNTPKDKGSGRGERKTQDGSPYVNPRPPLQANGIYHALAIPTAPNDLDCDRVPIISTLLGGYQGLVSMDKGIPTIRLVDFSSHLRPSPELVDRATSMMAEGAWCISASNASRIFQLVHSLTLEVRPSLNIRLYIGEPLFERGSQKRLRSSSLIGSIVTGLPSSLRCLLLKWLIGPSARF